MTDYPRCRTCRHWRVEDTDADGWGVCLLARTRIGDPVYAQTKARASDYDYYRGELFVTPDFGCVQHEETDDGTTQG